MAQRHRCGKLNIVMAEGRDLRLVLDSSVCGLNTAVHLPEHVSLPTALDVQRTFLSYDCHAQLFALSFRLQGHKCCKVHLTTRVPCCSGSAKLLCILVARTGSLILRCMHALLCNHAHRAWLYVDDLLALLRTVDKDIGSALIAAWLSALHAPISWKKAQFSQTVTWCGWLFRTDTETVELRLAKLPKHESSSHHCDSTARQRKELEAALGLLNWATSLSKHMRPFMAPLVQRSAPKSLCTASRRACGLPRQHGETNSHILGHVAATPRTASRSRRPQDQKQGRRASCAAIAQAPVRLADPHCAEIHLPPRK